MKTATILLTIAFVLWPLVEFACDPSDRQPFLVVRFFRAIIGG